MLRWPSRRISSISSSLFVVCGGADVNVLPLILFKSGVPIDI